MKKKEFAEVYVIEHQEKVMYVGVTACGLLKRMTHHKCCSELGKGGPKKLMPWMRETKNYTARVIEVCTFDSRLQREAFWIEHYDTVNNGLNSTHARGGGREKGCSNPSGPSHYMYGKKINEHVRQCVIKANKGRKLLPEHIEKIRSSNSRPGRKDNRPVVRDDGAEFYSINEAARQHGVTRKAISNAIQRNQKSSGHSWKHKDV